MDGNGLSPDKKKGGARPPPSFPGAGDLSAPAARPVPSDALADFLALFYGV